MLAVRQAHDRALPVQQPTPIISARLTLASVRPIPVFVTTLSPSAASSQVMPDRKKKIKTQASAAKLMLQ